MHGPMVFEIKDEIGVCHRTCTQELTRCRFYTTWTLADNLIGVGDSALNLRFDFSNHPGLPKNNEARMLRSWDP